MEKYNKVIECYDHGMESLYSFSSEQKDIIKKAYEDAENAIRDKADQFYRNLEGEVKDWTTNDYDNFIKTASHDNRVDAETVLMISAAYAKTHPTDKDRVNNATTKAAMRDMAMEKVNSILDLFGF